MNDLSSSDAPPRRLGPVLPFVLSGVLYSALATAVTFPLVTHLGSRVPKDLGDPLLTASILSWNAQVTPLTERWWDGFGFFPATGMMAFSEHFLGASLIATPLQRLGSPLVAYNLILLATFPLCALAAHFLGFALTRRHDAAIICGLAYGFSPYRFAHIEHLELLMSFGMPTALAALHLYTDTRTRSARWLLLFAASLVTQAVTCSYYALFFTVLVGLWGLWFMRPQAWRQILAVGVAGAVSVLVVLPVVRGYSRTHHSYRVVRQLCEVVQFSGDLSSLVTASEFSALWSWTSGLNGGERQLFPGLTITMIAVLGGAVAAQARPRAKQGRTALWILAVGLGACSAAFGALAIWALIGGPLAFLWGNIRIAIGSATEGVTLSALFALAATALNLAYRGRAPAAPRPAIPEGSAILATLSRWLWVGALASVVLGLLVSAQGPMSLNWGWLGVSTSLPSKAGTLAVILAAGAIALSNVLRRRSVFAFYLMAAATLFLCSLGPQPALRGERLLWESPYSGLMRLPFFSDTVRVPARFAMLAVLALSVAGCLAFTRLAQVRALRRHTFSLSLLVMAGILADAWTKEMPLAAPPAGLAIPPGDRSVAVMELPLGDVWKDTAALYRATLHGRRAVNGYNGYDPLYYRILRLALLEHDLTVIEALASFGPLLIAADGLDSDEPLASFLAGYPGIKRLGRDGQWTFLQVPAKVLPARVCPRNPAAVTSAFDERGLAILGLTDQEPATRRRTADPQRVGNQVIFDLGVEVRPCEVEVSLGREADEYPRLLSVATSSDRATWETGFVGKMGGAAFLAALENPDDARFSVPLTGKPARFIRLQIEQADPKYRWAIADVVVNAHWW